MTKTERQKLLDHIDKQNNEIDTNEAFADICAIIETFTFESLDDTTADMMQREVNYYFYRLEQDNKKVIYVLDLSHIVGAMIKLPGERNVIITWVRYDGSTIS